MQVTATADGGGAEGRAERARRVCSPQRPPALPRLAGVRLLTHRLDAFHRGCQVQRHAGQRAGGAAARQPHGRLAIVRLHML